jgi:hypothetical protein
MSTRMRTQPIAQIVAYIRTGQEGGEGRGGEGRREERREGRRECVRADATRVSADALGLRR